MRGINKVNDKGLFPVVGEFKTRDIFKMLPDLLSFSSILCVCCTFPAATGFHYHIVFVSTDLVGAERILGYCQIAAPAGGSVLLQDDARRSGDIAIDMDAKTSQQLQLIDEQASAAMGEWCPSKGRCGDVGIYLLHEPCLTAQLRLPKFHLLVVLRNNLHDL
eukprot:g41482.t1